MAAESSLLNDEAALLDPKLNNYKKLKELYDGGARYEGIEDDVNRMGKEITDEYKSLVDRQKQVEKEVAEIKKAKSERSYGSKWAESFTSISKQMIKGLVGVLPYRVAKGFVGKEESTGIRVAADMLRMGKITQEEHDKTVLAAKVRKKERLNAIEDYFEPRNMAIDQDAAGSGVSKEEFDKGFFLSVGAGEFSDAGAIAGYYFADALPSMIAVAGTGGYGLGIVGASSAGMKYDQLKDSSLSEKEKLANAFVTGAAEAFFEKYTQGMLGDMFKSMTREQIKKTLLARGKDFLTVMGVEAASEGLTQLAENIADVVTDVAGKKEYGIDDFLKGVGTSLEAGAVVGGAISGVKNAAELIIGSKVSDIADAVNELGIEQVKETVAEEVEVEVVENEKTNDKEVKRITKEEVARAEETKKELLEQRSLADKRIDKFNGLIEAGAYNEKQREEAEGIINDSYAELEEIAGKIRNIDNLIYKAAVQDVEEAKAIDDSVPEDLQGEERAEAIDTIKERNDIKEEIEELEAEKEKTDEAFHGPINEKIDAKKAKVDEMNEKLAGESAKEKKTDTKEEPVQEIADNIDAKNDPELVDLEDQKADIERRRQEEIKGNLNTLNIEDVRRRDGSIGTQGFAGTQMMELLNFMDSEIGLNIPFNLNDSSNLNEVIEYIKNNREVFDKIENYIKANPSATTTLPDGTVEFNDGNHRANLLNITGGKILPTIDNNVLNEINARYDSELGDLEGNKKQDGTKADESVPLLEEPVTEQTENETIENESETIENESETKTIKSQNKEYSYQRDEKGNIQFQDSKGEPVTGKARTKLIEDYIDQNADEIVQIDESAREFESEEQYFDHLTTESKDPTEIYEEHKRRKEERDQTLRDKGVNPTGRDLAHEFVSRGKLPKMAWQEVSQDSEIGKHLIAKPGESVLGASIGEIADAISAETGQKVSEKDVEDAMMARVQGKKYESPYTTALRDYNNKLQQLEERYADLTGGLPMTDKTVGLLTDAKKRYIDNGNRPPTKAEKINAAGGKKTDTQKRAEADIRYSEKAREIFSAPRRDKVNQEEANEIASDWTNIILSTDSIGDFISDFGSNVMSAIASSNNQAVWVSSVVVQNLIAELGKRPELTDIQEMQLRELFAIFNNQNSAGGIWLAASRHSANASSFASRAMVGLLNQVKEAFQRKGFDGKTLDQNITQLMKELANLRRQNTNLKKKINEAYDVIATGKPAGRGKGNVAATMSNEKKDAKAERLAKIQEKKAKAIEKWKKARGTTFNSGFLNSEQMEALGELGAAVFMEGYVNFTAWSTKVLEYAGEVIDQKVLNKIWDDGKYVVPWKDGKQSKAEGIDPFNAVAEGKKADLSNKPEWQDGKQSKAEGIDPFNAVAEGKKADLSNKPEWQDGKQSKAEGIDPFNAVAEGKKADLSNKPEWQQGPQSKQEFDKEIETIAEMSESRQEFIDALRSKPGWPSGTKGRKLAEGIADNVTNPSMMNALEDFLNKLGVKKNSKARKAIEKDFADNKISDEKIREHLAKHFEVVYIPDGGLGVLRGMQRAVEEAKGQYYKGLLLKEFMLEMTKYTVVTQRTIFGELRTALNMNAVSGFNTLFASTIPAIEKLMVDGAVEFVQNPVAWAHGMRAAFGPLGVNTGLKAFAAAVKNNYGSTEDIGTFLGDDISMSATKLERLALGKFKKGDSIMTHFARTYLQGWRTSMTLKGFDEVMTSAAGEFNLAVFQYKMLQREDGFKALTEGGKKFAPLDVVKNWLSIRDQVNKKYGELIKENMNTTDAKLDQYKDQAQAELDAYIASGNARKLKTKADKRAFLAIRVKELASETRDKIAQEVAYKEAKASIGMGEATGLLTYGLTTIGKMMQTRSSEDSGTMMGIVNSFRFLAGGVFGLFGKITGWGANQIVTGMPVVGIGHAFSHVYALDKKTGQWSFRPRTARETHKILMLNAMSTAVGIGAFFSTFDVEEDEDEDGNVSYYLKLEDDRWIDIVGDGKGDYYKNRENYEGKDHFIRFPDPNSPDGWGDKYSYEFWINIAPALSYVGHLSDLAKVNGGRFKIGGYKKEEGKEGKDHSNFVVEFFESQIAFMSSLTYGRQVDTVRKLAKSKSTDDFLFNSYKAGAAPVKNIVQPNLYKDFQNTVKSHVLDQGAKNSNTYVGATFSNLLVLDLFLKNEKTDRFGNKLYPTNTFRFFNNFGFAEWTDKNYQTFNNTEWKLTRKYENLTFPKIHLSDGPAVSSKIDIEFGSMVSKYMKDLEKMDQDGLEKGLSALYSASKRKVLAEEKNKK